MSAAPLAAELMLRTLGSVIDDQGAWYCSSPITSGRRYVSWLEDIGRLDLEIDQADERSREDHRRAVIEPNRAHAQTVVARLRATTDAIIIDPTAVPGIAGWQQGDWREFWASVIRTFVVRVVFVDHWEYSDGCAFEFLTAWRKGIPAQDELGRPLSASTGVSMIEGAIQDIARRGGSTKFLRSVVQELTGRQD